MNACQGDVACLMESRVKTLLLSLACGAALAGCAYPYPYYSGYATERRETTITLPLPAGTDGDVYLAALREGLDAIRAFEPDAPLILSLGFDTYHADPICDFALVTDDYARIGAAVRSLGMPVVALQEGGYAIDALAANAVAFLGALDGLVEAAAES